MATVLAFEGKSPVIPASVFLAEGSRIIGDVQVGPESSVWFNAVLRGDVNSIRVGDRTNVQDNATLHVTNGMAPVTVGSLVTIGHGAILHGCAVGDRCLIGMGAIVLDHSEIGADSIVGAGSLVREGVVVPPGVLIAGNPATIRRELTSAEKASLKQAAERYVEYARSYRKNNAGALSS